MSGNKIDELFNKLNEFYNIIDLLFKDGKLHPGMDHLKIMYVMNDRLPKLIQMIKNEKCIKREIYEDAHIGVNKKIVIDKLTVPIIVNTYVFIYEQNIKNKKISGLSIEQAIRLDEMINTCKNLILSLVEK